MSDQETRTEDAREGAAAAAEARPRGRQRGEKRELEQAPLMLRKAATILFVGAVLPFSAAIVYAGGGAAGAAVPWGALYGAKALALLGCWIFHQGYMATHGGKASIDAFDHVARAHHAVLPAIAGAAWVGALALVFTGTGDYWFAASAEVLTLILAGATYSHIFGYEHGGKFNPIFPLMFLGPAIAGLLNVFGAFAAFGGERAAFAAIGLVGSLVVAAGGCMAIYTMYASMKQAKIEGEIKRTAQREERKRQRDAQRAERTSGPG